MGFAEIYRNEVLQSRRDRARRAFFWARLIGLVLMVTVAAALRSEPGLTRQLMLAAMDAVKPAVHQGDVGFQAQGADGAPDKRLPTSRIKINRPEAPAGGAMMSGGVDVQASAEAAAQRLDGLRH